MISDIKKIAIDCAEYDIKITDGDAFKSKNVSYYVDDGCLFIEAYDDGYVTISNNFYGDIKIDGTCGDIDIIFKKALIKDLEFKSESGDLTVDAFCDSISFDSPGGDYIRKKGTPQKQIVNLRKPMNVKESTTVLPIKDTPSWKNGERYK